MRGPDDQMSISEQVQSQAACLLSLCSCKDERDMSSPAHFCLAEGLILQFELALALCKDQDCHEARHVTLVWHGAEKCGCLADALQGICLGKGANCQVPAEMSAPCQTESNPSHRSSRHSVPPAPFRGAP